MISCGIAVPGRKFTLAFFRFEVSQQPGQQATSDPLNSIIGDGRLSSKCNTEKDLKRGAPA